MDTLLYQKPAAIKASPSAAQNGTTAGCFTNEKYTEDRMNRAPLTQQNRAVVLLERSAFDTMFLKAVSVVWAISLQETEQTSLPLLVR